MYVTLKKTHPRSEDTSSSFASKSKKLATGSDRDRDISQRLGPMEGDLALMKLNQNANGVLSSQNAYLNKLSQAIYSTNLQQVEQKRILNIIDDVPTPPQLPLTTDITLIKRHIYPDLSKNFYHTPLAWSPHGSSVGKLFVANKNEICIQNPASNTIHALSASRGWGTNWQYSSVAVYDNTIVAGIDSAVMINKHKSGNSALHTYDVITGQPFRYLWKVDKRINVISNFHQHFIAAGSKGNLYIVDNNLNDKKTIPTGLGICGLSYNGVNQIATGHNDNTFKVWDIRNWEKPFFECMEHNGAVKGLAFSPVASNILASGGGVDDCRILIWDLNTSEKMVVPQLARKDEQGLSTSQVCNLTWADSDTILSTHGHPHNGDSTLNHNEINNWHVDKKHNQLIPQQHFEYDSRIIFAAIEPTQRKVYVAASDSKNLLFWNVNQKKPAEKIKESAFEPEKSLPKIR